MLPLDKGELHSSLSYGRRLCHTDLMTTTRRQLCFMGPALCAAPVFGSAVEKLWGTADPSNNSAVNQKDSSFPSKDLRNLVIGAGHEIAGQLMLTAGWTQLAQEKLDEADLATVKAYLHAAQEATQRASVVINLMRNEIRKKPVPPRARG